MEIILEFVVGFVIEMVLGIVGEILVELGFHSVAERFSDRAWKRVITGFAYGVFGFALGWLSLFFLPKLQLENRSIVVIYFILSPIIAGLALCGINWIIHRGIERVAFFQLTKFLYGAFFVLAYAVARAILG
jgi:hypothetical protein